MIPYSLTQCIASFYYFNLISSRVGYVKFNLNIKHGDIKKNVISKENCNNLIIIPLR